MPISILKGGYTIKLKIFLPAIILSALVLAYSVYKLIELGYFLDEHNIMDGSYATYGTVLWVLLFLAGVACIFWSFFFISEYIKTFAFIAISVWLVIAVLLIYVINNDNEIVTSLFLSLFLLIT